MVAHALLCLSSPIAAQQASIALGGDGARYAALLGGRALTIAPVESTAAGANAHSWRAVSRLVRDGDKRDAIALSDSLMKRGAPRGAARADFTRAVLDMIAYQRPDSALVVGAGVRELWANLGDGVRVAGLRTSRGTLDLSMFGGGRRVNVHLGGSYRPSAAGILVYSPYDSPVLAAIVNGAPATIVDRRYIVVRALPADIAFGH